MSGHSDLGISEILEHLPFSPGYKQRLRQLLVLQAGNLEIICMILTAVIVQ